jgi:hypothetical protein
VGQTRDALHRRLEAIEDVVVWQGEVAQDHVAHFRQQVGLFWEVVADRRRRDVCGLGDRRHGGRP